ncbi:heterokaryon incompatibility protein het-E-1 [Fusarium mundagurra]|uniref:Heterokaryon incompatibility protein het-E-1 n=1 Tax=Fusarium mundagurra TaxID=1567541 RepID=A0A8H5Z7N3_9HYPO|nr:heterokaryon incompatibility protein het-E-1 [Fusarium mundagurra]
MENSTSSTVQSLNASGSSRVHVGNSYNITHQHGRGSEDNGAKKYLDALRSTDPRDDKARIEQTNGGLLKDSYVWILDSPEFITWRDESEGGRLLWIRGDPGKGKTMLLSGLINELQPFTKLESPQKRNTMSFFFCQATNSGLNNYTAILKGLVYLLVIQHSALVAHLKDKHQHDKDHWNSKVSLERIFRKMLEDPGLGEIYLLVDALDECVEDLHLLLALISGTSSRAKWIVTSRNRCEIEELLGQTSSKVALSLEIHEESVSGAVNNYISYRTRQLSERKKLKKSIADQIHNHLSQNAHGTFLWVALVCQRLERCRAWEIADQVSQFPPGLHQLYAQMMDQMRKSDSHDLYMRVLAVASTAFRPLTFAELIAMEDLNIDEETIPDLIVECGSFLTTKGNTVVFVHKSAKDFLLRESSNLLFRSGLARHQYKLFQRCIDILQSLHKDMYGLFYPGVSLDEAHRNRPHPDPLHDSKYACIFWADHMQEAYKLFVEDDIIDDFHGADTAHNFIAEKFLFWLEALVLRQNLSAAVKALRILRDLLDKEQANYKALLEDALRFLYLFSPGMESYPLQIYASGLLFSPQQSLVRRRFQPHTSGIFSKFPKVDDHWSPIRSTFDIHEYLDHFETVMTFAPSSDLLLVTTRLSLTRWHVNHEPIPEVVKKDAIYERTASSPDGKWLALVSTSSHKNFEKQSQRTLHVRNWELHRTIWSKDLGYRRVHGITISPDSQCLLVLYDEELEVYNIEGVMSRLCPLGTNIRFAKFSFSSDSTWVALEIAMVTRSISYVILYVIDLRTGNRYKSRNDEYIGKICDAAFIPNTHSLMICTVKNTVYLWNVLEGKLETWGHFDHGVSRLAFSHSDSWLALSGNGWLFIYDRAHRTLLKEIQVPSRGRIAVSFDDETFDDETIAVSFDDETIACVAKNRIHLVDVRALLANERPSRVRGQDSLTCSCMSNNGQRIAYQLGGRIEVWDTAKQDIQCSVAISDVIHGKAWAMAVSPNGYYLAIGGESFISVWDLNNQSFRRLSTHINSEGPLAVSERIPTGSQWVVALQHGGGLSVWDIMTKKPKRSIERLNASKPAVCSIAFAGSRLGVLWCEGSVAGSSQRPLFLLYNVRTCQQLSQINLFEFSTSIDYDFLFAHPIIKFSPSGELVMLQHSPEDSLVLCDLRADGKCIQIENWFSLFFFLEEFTVSTDKGVFHINSIEPSLWKSRKLETKDKGMSLPFEDLTCRQYSKEGEWIKFDNKPLLWLPPQYRGDALAIGYDFVIIEHFSYFYSIQFASEVDTLMRQALQNLI